MLHVVAPSSLCLAAFLQLFERYQNLQVRWTHRRDRIWPLICRSGLDMSTGVIRVLQIFDLAAMKVTGSLGTKRGIAMKLDFIEVDSGFALHLAGRVLLCHSPDSPALTVGRGLPEVAMLRGNFRIADAPYGLIKPRQWTRDGDHVMLFDGDVPVARIDLFDAGIAVTALDSAHNRLWLRFHAEPEEVVWGGGEQMSYLALNGRRFPMWTSEPGVGRDKTTALTQVMDETAMAGGEYWNTNYPIFLIEHITRLKYGQIVPALTCSQPTVRKTWSGSCRRILADRRRCLIGRSAGRSWGSSRVKPALPGSTSFWPRAQMLRRYGAKTGRAFAKPALVAGCFGIGATAPRAILACPIASVTCMLAVSGSWLMQTPIWRSTARCFGKRKQAAICACGRIAMRPIWSISANSIAAWWTSRSRPLAPGSKRS